MSARDSVISYVIVAVTCVLAAVAWAVQDDAWARAKCAERLRVATTAADSVRALDSRPQWLSRRFADRCRVLVRP
jgi:hypothetical protein